MTRRPVVRRGYDIGASPALGVVILAAGASKRMGAPKMLLPWKGTTILGHLLDQWSKLAAAQIAIVHSKTDAVIAAELDRLQFPAANRIWNPVPEEGMFGSILCAAQWGGWQHALSHWVIALGDQPHLDIEMLRALWACAQAQPCKICQPTFQNRPRHPVILPMEAWTRLGRAPKTTTLRQFLEAERAEVCAMPHDDVGLALDIDTPEQYREALRLPTS